MPAIIYAYFTAFCATFRSAVTHSFKSTYFATFDTTHELAKYAAISTTQLAAHCRAYCATFNAAIYATISTAVRHSFESTHFATFDTTYELAHLSAISTT